MRSTGTFPREPRSAVVVPIRYRYESILDFVETQSINISRTGIFVASEEALPVGTLVELEIGLADGFVLLRGRTEVARVSATPPGLGLRFRALDDASRGLIERIVDVNSREGKRPTVSLEFNEAPLGGTPAMGVALSNSILGAASSTPAARSGVVLQDQSLRVQLNPATVSFFVSNPLLNIKLGGFVIPAEQDVPLGTTFTVAITDIGGTNIFDGPGKVVAKHERRLGVRLIDASKATLARLQAEVAKVAPK